MNVLIIGGTRFMGPVVAEKLLADGHQVTVFHRGESEPEMPPAIRHIHADRADLTDHRADIERIRPDVILDMMALTQQHAVDLVSTAKDLTGRLVVASSCDVYQNYGLLWRTESNGSTDGRVDEEGRVRHNLYPYRKQVKGPEDILYEYDKILVEQEIMQSGIPSTVLRLPMVYGPLDRQHRLYSYVKRMNDNRPAILIDRDRAHWRGIRGYRDNCAHALHLAVTDPRAAGRVYNVGERHAMTEMEWIEAIATELGWNGTIIGAPRDQLPGYLQADLDWNHNLDIDTTRIRTELGFDEPVSFAEGIRRTVDWELSHPPQDPLDRFDYEAEDKVFLRIWKRQVMF